MPKIPDSIKEELADAAKPTTPKQARKFGGSTESKTRWVCPRCGAVHWYPFKDGCHAKCGHTGALKSQ